MCAKVCAFLFACLVVTLSWRAISAEEPPPLVVDFVVDPVILHGLSGDEELGTRLADITNRASLIFNAEIGRRLAVGRVWVASPAIPASEPIDAEAVMQWLADNFKSQTASRFIVFLSGRAVFAGNINVDGYNEGAGGRLLIVKYFKSNPQYTADIQLHEIGHNCGAVHAASRESIMNDEQKDAISYKESIPVIRENCGAK